MQIIPFIYDTDDELLSNTYLFIDAHNSCVVIDPSKDYNGIVDYINKNKLNLKAILITHAHFDHIGGINRLVQAFNVPIYAGYEDVPYFNDAYNNCSEYGNTHVVVNHKIIPLGDNELIKLLDEDIKVIYTPYHTVGSVCYYLEASKVLFSGDSLFYHSLGRFDLPTSVPSKVKESINKLLKLDDEVKVYPGHGKFTSIGNERKYINILMSMTLQGKDL